MVRFSVVSPCGPLHGRLQSITHQSPDTPKYPISHPVPAATEESGHLIVGEVSHELHLPSAIPGR